MRNRGDHGDHAGDSSESRLIELPGETTGQNGSPALGRRSFLRLGAVGAMAPLLARCGGERGRLAGLSGRAAGLAGDASCSSSSRGASWMYGARIGGLRNYDEELEVALDTLSATGITVVEGDTNLSQYLSDAEFDTTVALMGRVATAAHARDMRLVWYWPSLEVLTANAVDPATRTMFRDHPTWVQYGITGKPNVSIGSGGHWVSSDAESAWMCHNSPYREWFFKRLEKVARSGTDAIWLDVPLFHDTAAHWSCASTFCRDKFKAETGLTMPTVAETWGDLAWRRFMAWRHYELARFQRDCVVKAKSINPSLEVVFETVPMDYSNATLMGLDASQTFSNDNVMRVWEIDSPSNTLGMKPASYDDWICKIRMLKFARGCDGPRPSWAFSYGNEELDAGLTMAALFATQCCAFECKTPSMPDTVSEDFRARMFGWVADHYDILYNSKQECRIGVIHSSSSRDYIDQGVVDAMYSSVDTAGLDPTYWKSDAAMSVNKAVYLGDYTGTCKALSHLHVPFAIVPLLSVVDSTCFTGFDVLFAPSLLSASGAQVAMLKTFVSGGGVLVVTGPNPGRDDEYGTARAGGGLDKVFGFDASLPSARASYGKGEVYYYADRLGSKYLDDDASPVLATFKTLASKGGPALIDADADKHVHMELAKLGAQWVVHAVNYTGARSSALPSDGYPFSYALAKRAVDVTVSVLLPTGATVSSVLLYSPDDGFVEAPAAFTMVGGRVRFTMNVGQYTVAVVST